MRFCPSCIWVDCLVLWNRMFPVRSELRKMSLTLAALAQATIHTHNRVNQLRKHVMSNEQAVNELDAVVEALADKINENNATLRGLAEEVLALRADLGKSDIEAAVAAVKAKAQAALDSLTVAEDNADDALPAPTPAPTPEPAPAPAPEPAPEPAPAPAPEAPAPEAPTA